jgi:hypothetical protein
MLSFLVVARREGRPLLAVWPNNDACPGAFSEIFEPISGLHVVEGAPPGIRADAAPHGHDFHPQVKDTSAEWLGYDELIPVKVVRDMVAASVRKLSPSFVSVHVSA